MRRNEDLLMAKPDRPTHVNDVVSAGKRIELDLLDGMRNLGDRLHAGAQHLVDLTALQTCSKPLVVFSVAAILAAILTRSAWHPKEES